MSNLASSAVHVNARWDALASGDGKRQVVDATLTLTGQGDATDKINASVLGLATVDAVLSLQKSDNTSVSACPSYNRAFILITVGGDSAPSTTSGTFRAVIMGKPKL